MSNKVSVILPCYNQGIYLTEALDSVLRQTCSDWEAIIVNDGSSDCTEQVALEYMDKDERIRYYKQENKGVSAARNLGISKAEGEYILPLDPDDKLMPEFIDKCLNYLMQHPQCTLVYTQTCFFGIKKGLWKLPAYSDYKLLLLKNCIVCTALLRREDCLKIGGYDEEMRTGLEDWEFYIRLLGEHTIVHQVSEPLFFYRIKEVSRNTECNRKEVYQKILMYIYKKHIECYAYYYGIPLELLQDLAFYKRKYEQHHNKWYRKLWRRIRRKN